MKKFVFFGVLVLFVFFLFIFVVDKLVCIGIEVVYLLFLLKILDGQLVGFDVDIGNVFCEEMKVQCKWVEQEFDGLILVFKVCKIDVIFLLMIIIDECKCLVDFINKYYNILVCFVMKEGVSFNDFKVDLKGKKVGVLCGSIVDCYVFVELILVGVEVVCYNFQQEVNMDLVVGCFDVVVVDLVNFEDGFFKIDVGKGYVFVGL